jgi:hypothetical protein
VVVVVVVVVDVEAEVGLVAFVVVDDDDVPLEG